MVDASMKHMALNFAKIDKFEGVDFRRWENATMEQIRKRNKCDNDDYVCRGLILNDFKYTLKHQKEELTYIELVSHLRIEKSLKVQDNDKPKSNNVVGPLVDDDVSWWVYSGATVHMCKDRCWFKTYESLNDESIFHMGNESSALVYGRGCVDLRFSSGKIVSLAVVRLPDLKLKTLGERGIKCIFVGYVDHSKDFRIYVIEPNESVLINSIIELRDAIFDEKILSSVPRPSLRIPNRTKDIGGSVVPEEDDPKTFDEAMKYHDVVNLLVENGSSKRNLKVDGTIKKFKARLVIQGFRQKLGIDYFDTYALVARINTIRLLIALASIYIMIIHQIDVKTTFLNGQLDEEVDLTKEFLSSRFFMKDMGEDDVILMSTPIDTSEKLMPNNGQAISQLIILGYTSNPGTQHLQAIQRVLKYLKKTMDYSMTYIGYTSVLEGYTDASWINNTEDNSSTSGWVFLLGGGAISWASKKQTCITSSIMKYEFVALATAGKEAEWLRNLILEIPLWSKLIAPIYILCDSVATLTKAYIQMYNEKSRHLGVRHSMIHELIMNGVVSSSGNVPS
ncbi:zinc finger, CCHC-type containing protein [Tanacetum coccineum]